MKKTLFLTSGILASAASSFAADVAWVRGYSSNSANSYSFSNPNSGTLTVDGNQTTSGSFAFNYATYTATSPSTDVIVAGASPHAGNLSAGEFFEFDYDLDHYIEDGDVTMTGGWQVSDYTFEIFGGDGVIDTTGITFATDGFSVDNGILGVDYSISGNGTSSITLNNLRSSGGAFHGSFTLDGEWKGLKVRQTHNANNSNSHFLDFAASSEISSMTVGAPVPEPSTGLLSLFASALLLRRKRQA